MENGTKTRMSNCDLSAVKPAVMALPYPRVQVQGMNQDYAALLSVSYCGTISELSATMQYINNESRMVANQCLMGKTLLRMALAEMTHMQMLAELISLLGGNVCYTATQPGGQQRMWSPQCLSLPEKFSEMLQADLESEMAAINQYNMQIRMIRDDYVNDVLRRIVQDEQYHIMLIRSMMDTL